MIGAVLYENTPTGLKVLRSAGFDNPQDALKFLWDEAEQADHDAGPLIGEIDGKPVKL